ncbi:MAG: hypothetical protein BroJett040_23640 [Oligoflexia bacterium]|nr:MAG: hypothetical protein BroJett040_23640 [Oligoflexia bacterium]
MGRVRKQASSLSCGVEGLYEVFPLALITVSSNGLIQQVNDQAISLLGYSPPEMIKSSFLGIVAEEDQEVVRHDLLVNSHQASEGQVHLLDRNKTKITCRYIVSRIRSDADGNQHCKLITLIDETDRLIQEKIALERQSSMMYTTTMSSLAQMAGAIAHEINNPLAIISSSAQQIKNKISSEDINEKEKFIAGLERIQGTVERIANIVSSLRMISHNADQETFQIVSLAEVVKVALMLCEERCRESQIQLTVDTIPSVSIECRSVQIPQVLLSLLENAIEAVDELKEKWIRIGFTLLQDSVQIEIIDSGSGIPVDVQKRMMEPFFTTKFEKKGVGLGLSVARGLIEQHRGTIKLDSNSPHTKFLVRIPIQQKGESLIPLDIEEAIQAHLGWKNKLRSYFAKPDQSLHPEQIEQDHLCSLGKWIYGHGHESQKESELFVKLKDEHKTFHKIAADLVRRSDRGEGGLLRQLVDLSSSYNRCSSKVIYYLEELKKKV